MIATKIHPKDTLRDKSASFVDAVLKRCKKDKGYAARLRRADNPDTEYQCWETLAAFGVDLEKEYQRLPYATVAAAVAKNKSGKSGSLTLGRAIAQCYEDGNANDQAKAKIRRLLACQNITETCRILRPMLTLIESRIGRPLDYSRLLNQLLRFSWYQQGVKSQWAQEFYAKTQGNSGEEAA